METSNPAWRTGPTARDEWTVSGSTSMETVHMPSTSTFTRSPGSSSAVLIDSLTGQRDDALYVTEWWLPGDEVSAG